MHVFAVGASRNTGYYTCLRLLAQGASVTFLLRSPSSLEADPVISPYINSGKVHLVKGDALNLVDVAKGWEEALRAGNGYIDLALFTVGGGPGQATFHIFKGLVLDPPDLVTHCFLNLVRTIPPSLRSPSSAQPRIVAISSIGITSVGYKKLPIILKPVFSYMLTSIQDDKLGAETIVAHYVGRDFPDPAKPEVLKSTWKEEEGVMERGSYKKIVVVRPTMLTDSECQGDKIAAAGKAPYKLGEDDVTGWSISRKDIAHFVAEELTKDEEWEKWEGKCAAISY